MAEKKRICRDWEKNGWNDGARRTRCLTAEGFEEQGDQIITNTNVRYSQMIFQETKIWYHCFRKYIKGISNLENLDIKSIIRSQEKKFEPEPGFEPQTSGFQPGDLPLELSWFSCQLMLRSYNVNFPRYKLWVCFQLIIWFEYQFYVL